MGCTRQEDGETAEELESDGRPRHQMRRWNPEPLKRRSKVIRPIRNLGVAVRDEAVAHDQPQLEPPTSVESLKRRSPLSPGASTSRYVERWRKYSAEYSPPSGH